MQSRTRRQASTNVSGQANLQRGNDLHVDVQQGRLNTEICLFWAVVERRRMGTDPLGEARSRPFESDGRRLRRAGAADCHWSVAMKVRVGRSMDP